ncbi:hypothetical protein [uncultured Winogradskyella sp.]|uniref:hypothetical protein n=1 Tax=uncultured Winogradskyella sp. TaxID=395353 RepID=UPI0026067631|nr:hypothetical protein [uncultured Winogradskyella sp.]
MLAISFGCERESIDSQEQDLNSKSKYDSNVDIQKRGNRDLPMNEIIGDTLTVFIDYNDGVAWLEDYDNTSLGGPVNFDPIENFISNYRADMSANFTIYSIQASTVSNCGYVDKWLVNVHEYRALFATPFVTTFNTTTNATKHRPKPENHPDQDNEGEIPNTIDLTVAFPYDLCF